MAADDSSGKPAGPVVLRIKLRYDDVEAMVQRFAPNVGKSGLFLPTKSIQPIGTEVKFELRIANDTAVLVGLGKVRAVRHPDPANPKAAFGMAIELMRVTRESREVIMRMIERRRAMGLPNVTIPMPEDVDSARRADVETQPKAVVPHAPEPVSESRPSVRESQLLTSPRPGSGPIARAKAEPSRPSAPALAPEPTKARRPRVTELIAKANESSGALAAVTVPGLDEHVDVARALVRARALAGGDLDTELANLRESAAAPVEISIEAASAELARQLGGAAIVKRDRSTRWAPPPAIERSGGTATAVTAETATATASASAIASASASDSEAVAVAGSVSDPASDSASDSASDPASDPASVGDPAFADPDAASDFRAPSVSDATATSDTLDDESRQEFRRPATSSAEMDQLAAEQALAIATREAGAVTAVEPEPALPSHSDEPPPEPAVAVPRAVQPAVLIDDDADVSSFGLALDAARIHTGVAQAAPPSDMPEDDDEIEQLDSLDLELADESTEIGAMPVDPNAYTTTPAAHDELADRLDQQLAAAEVEANSDFAIALTPQPTYDTLAEPPADDFAEEEISDLDVLAEADADDADLLNADGERDASDSHEVPPAPAPAAPAYDFAAQLDLGDDETPRPVDADDPNYDPPSSSYTFAENYPQAASTFDDPRGFTGAEDFDEPHHFTQGADPRRFGAQPQSFDDASRFTPPAMQFDEPHGFAARDDELDGRGAPVAKPPRPVRDPVPTSPAMLHAPPRPAKDDDSDLEDALSTLDVDLDQLEIPHDPPSQSRGRPLPGMPPERAPVDVETLRPGSASGRVSLPRDSPRSASAALNAKAATKQPRAKRAVTEDEGVLIDFDDDE